MNEKLKIKLKSNSKPRPKTTREGSKRAHEQFLAKLELLKYI